MWFYLEVVHMSHENLSCLTMSAWLYTCIEFVCVWEVWLRSSSLKKCSFTLAMMAKLLLPEKNSHIVLCRPTAAIINSAGVCVCVCFASICPDWQHKTITIRSYLSLVLSPQIRFHSELHGLQPVTADGREKEKLSSECRFMPDAVCLSVGRKSKEKSKQGLINGFCHPVTLFFKLQRNNEIPLATHSPLCQFYKQGKLDFFCFSLGGRQAENITTVADRYWRRVLRKIPPVCHV